MKRLLFSLTFILCVWFSAFGQTPIIRGVLFNDKDEREKGIKVVAHGRTSITDANGEFTITFDPPVQPGTRVTLSVEKPDWFVLIPFMGRDRVQNKEFSTDRIEITIARRRSPRFLEPNSLSQLIAAQGNAGLGFEVGKSNNSQTQFARELEKERLVEEYAALSGFSVAEIHAALEDWKRSKLALGSKDEALQAYANGQPGEAAEKFLAGARNLGASFARKKLDLKTDAKEIIDRYMRAGTGFFEAAEFRKALLTFEELDQQWFETGEITKSEFMAQWLYLRGFMARTKVQLSYFTKHDEAIKLLTAAAEDFTKALSFTSSHQFLEERARLQFNLGATLLALGDRANSSVSNWKSAAAAFKEAEISGQRLQELGYPFWGTYIPQISWATVWIRVAERTGEPEHLAYLKDVLSVLDKAEKSIIRELDPIKWAALRDNQGRALSRLARSTRDPSKNKELIDKALLAFEDEARTYENLLQPEFIKCSPCAGPMFISLAIANMQLADTTPANDKGLAYLQKAIEALNQADKLIDRAKDAYNWASLKANLGSVYFGQAKRTDENSFQHEEYLFKAMLAFEAASVVQSDGPCSVCAGSTFIDLGIARTQLAPRADTRTETFDYFTKALDAYAKAEAVVKRDEDVLLWVTLKANQGQAFSGLSYVVRVTEPAKYLDYQSKALQCFREAKAFYSLGDYPKEWTAVRMDLANMYAERQEWPAAFEEVNSVLMEFPEHAEAYHLKLGILHDGRFEFEEAFALSKAWLDRHPDDLIAQYELTERLFTTGRFSECRQHVDNILRSSQTPVDVRTAMRAIDIGCTLGTNQIDEIRSKLDLMIEEVRSQPSGFQVGWVFFGSRYFLGQNTKLTPYRPWADRLFGALALDHEGMLRDLTLARETFGVSH